MNKRFWLSTLVFFVVAMGTDFLLHGLLLNGDYAQLPNIMRSEADSQQHFPIMLLAHVFIAIAFVWIYQRGCEDKTLAGAGTTFWCRCCLPDSHTDLHDLLRGATASRDVGDQANRI